MIPDQPITRVHMKANIDLVLQSGTHSVSHYPTQQRTSPVVLVVPGYTHVWCLFPEAPSHPRTL